MAYALAICVIRITAIILFFTLDNDYNQNALAVLSASSYFYLIYALVESMICLALVILTIKFYLYHSWLQSNNLTTYQHILILRDKNMKKARVRPANSPETGKDEGGSQAKPEHVKIKGIKVVI